MTRKPTDFAEPAFPINLPQTPEEYLDILRFRWYWIVIGVVLGALGSQIAVRRVPERFTSNTVVLVESDKIPRDFIPQMTTQRPADRLATVHEEILARPRIERILEELDPYPELLDVPRADIIEMIRGRTLITRRGRDAFILKYEDTNPERAQLMATRLASLFIEETSGDRRRQIQGANEFIDSQLEQTKAELRQVEASLSAIKNRYMGMLPNQLEANLATLQRLQLEQQSISDESRGAKDRKSLLERQRALQAQMNEPEAQLIPDLSGPLSSDATSAGPSTLAQLSAYLDQLRTRYTEEHPEVRTVLARIARLERQQAANPEPVEAPSPEQPVESASTISEDIMLADLTAQIAFVRRDIEELDSRADLVRQDIARYQARVEKIPEVQNELQALEREYGLISQYYSQLRGRKLQAATADDVEKRWNQEQFKILDPAQVPEKASYPNPMLFLLIGTALGLGAGLALSFLLEILDASVKSRRQLEALVPYPIVLTLPKLKTPKKPRRRKDAEPAPPTPPKTSTADAEELSAAS